MIFKEYIYEFDNFIINPKLLIVFTLLLVSCISNAQNIIGHVYYSDAKGNKVAISGANIQFNGSIIGTITDKNGLFSVSHETADSLYLVATSNGFDSDSILIAGKDSIIRPSGSVAVANCKVDI